MKYWKPIVLQFIRFIFTIPFNEIMLHMNYKLNENKRNKVVKMIETGELVENVSYNSSLIKLPKEYQSLSSGGGELL